MIVNFKIFETTQRGTDNILASLPGDIKTIHSIFKDAGYKLYLVGGAVRDALNGDKPKDFDLATDAKPNEIIKILKDQYRLNQQGVAFGVIVVYTEESPEGHEIATFREDVSSGRHPEIKVGATIDKDVLRRDLTINSLFFDLDKSEIVDLVGGIEDLQNGTIRTVGNPKDRFDEDRLRVMRAARFAARYGKMNDETFNAIKNNPSLVGVSRERVYDEFVKGLKQSKSVVNYMRILLKTGLLPEIFKGYNINSDFVESRDINVVLAVLLDISHNLNYLVSKLKFPLDIRNRVSTLLSFIRTDINKEVLKLYTDVERFQVTPEQLKAFIEHINPTLLPIIVRFNKYKPTVSGNDLIARGFVGKEIGIEKARLESELFAKIKD